MSDEYPALPAGRFAPARRYAAVDTTIYRQRLAEGWVVERVETWTVDGAPRDFALIVAPSGPPG